MQLFSCQHSHWQRPALHFLPRAHKLPQLPQLRLSVSLLVQTLPLQMSGLLLGQEQPPLTHTEPLLQRFPQLPQLAGSARKLTQRPAQSFWLTLQRPVGMHAPPAQAPEGHTRPHTPQFLLHADALGRGAALLGAACGALAAAADALEGGAAALAAVAAVALIGEEGDALAAAALLGAGVAGQQAAVEAGLHRHARQQQGCGKVDSPVHDGLISMSEV